VIRAANGLVLMVILLAPLSATAQAALGLTATQVSKIAALIHWKGVAVTVYPGVRASLGMNISGPEFKQLTVIQHSTGVTHGIEILPNSEGYVLIRKPGQPYSDVYRADAGFDERGSVRATDVGDTSAIPADVDAEEFRQELAFWSMAADTLPPPPPEDSQSDTNGGSPPTSGAGATAQAPQPAVGALAVQLGAFSTESAAGARLRQLQPFPPGLRSEISLARSNAAQYYRAAVTGFGSRAQAEAFCSARGIAGAACWVRPADAR
jgi:hypothetical protein